MNSKPDESKRKLMWEGAKGYCIGRSERKKQRLDKSLNGKRSPESKEQKDINRKISSSSLKNSTQAY